MPWWALLALTAFAFVSVVGVRESVRSDTPGWVALAEIVGSGLLLVLATGYWLGSGLSAIKPIAPIMLVIALGLTVLEVGRDLRSADASRGEKLTAVGLVAILCALPVYWAVMFAVFGKVAT